MRQNIYTWNKNASNNILLNNKWFGTLERCVSRTLSLSSRTIFQIILHKIPIYKTSESWASLVRESWRKPKEPSAPGVFHPWRDSLASKAFGITKVIKFKTSLVAQWWRICLPVQETWGQSLIWEDPTCHRASKPVHHNYWACALEPAGTTAELMRHNYWSPCALDPMFYSKRSHCCRRPHPAARE